MKQKDIALIVLIIGISAVASLFISKALFSSPNNRKEQVEIVQKITDEFPTPDPRFFNKDSFDPTKLITIGQNVTTDPFQGTAE